MFEALPRAHSPCCSTLYKQYQALHRLAPKRLRSWQPKVDRNPRKYRCGCSNERSTSEPSPDNADPQETKQRSEAKPSASSSQEQDRRHAEMYEMLKKTIRGAPGGSARQELPLSYMWKKDLKKLGQALPFTLGIPGSLAVVAGYYLHIDPYGHLHWSLPDALTGLAWALPIALLDACLLLPDVSDKASDMTVISKDQLQGLSSAKGQESAKSTVQPTASQSGAIDTPNNSQQTASADQVKAVLAAVLQHDQDQSKEHTDTEAATVKDERTSSSPSKPSLERRSKQAQAAVQMQSTLLDKLRNPKPLSLRGAIGGWQRETVTANPWLQSMPVTEGVSIVLRQLPWIMLSRAILQTGLSGWLADRFYEAGADDVVSLIGNQPIPTPEAAQWTALAVIVGLYTGLALYTPSGFGQIGVINLPGMGKSGNPVMGKDRVELAKKREKVLKQIQQRVAQRQQAKTVISCIRLAAANIAYGSSYIVTGNLLAPYVASVASRVLFSFEQRVKHQRWNADFKQKLEVLLERSAAAVKADS